MLTMCKPIVKAIIGVPIGIAFMKGGQAAGPTDSQVHGLLKTTHQKKTDSAKVAGVRVGRGERGKTE